MKLKRFITGWNGGFAVVIAAASVVRAGQLTPYEAMQQRIEFLQKTLLASQKPDGSWPAFGQDGGDRIASGSFSAPNGPGVNAPGGVTALVVASLARSGVDPEGSALRKAGHYLDKLEPATTAGRSLRALASAAMITAGAAGLHHRRLQQDLEWLLKTRRTGGGWARVDAKPPRRGPRGNRATKPPRADNFHTALALWAIAEAAAVRAGPVPLRPQAVAGYWLKRQNPDGGWGVRDKADSDLGITAAVVAGLQALRICAGRSRGRHGVGTGSAAPVGKMLDRAVDLLRAEAPDDEEFSEWDLYRLINLDRAGASLGSPGLAGIDWFVRQCEGLTGRLDRPPDSLVAGALELIFLSAGNAVSLLNGLATGPTGGPDALALAGLTQMLGPELRRPLRWQRVGIDEPLAVWHSAPLLYVSADALGALKGGAADRLKRYLDTGGTLIAESDSAGKVKRSWTELAGRLYPRGDLRPLPADHPIFRIKWPIRGRTHVVGLGNGARDFMFLLPRNLSRAWRRRDLKRMSARFHLIGNIYLYATNRTLRGRARPRSGLPRLDRAGRHHKTVAIIRHAGRFNPNPAAFEELSKYMVARFDVDVEAAGPFSPADPEILNYRIAWMTGQEDPRLSVPQIRGLREFIAAGGTVVIDAHYGRSAFVKAVQRLLRDLLDDARPMALPLSHPIMTGKIEKWSANSLEDLELKAPPEGAEASATGNPSLTVLRSGKRLAVIFSPYDITSGLAGDTAYGGLGYTVDSATRLAANIILYADP